MADCLLPATEALLTAGVRAAGQLAAQVQLMEATICQEILAQGWGRDQWASRNQDLMSVLLRPWEPWPAPIAQCRCLSSGAGAGPLSETPLCFVGGRSRTP